jgi:hypothetical protein
VGAALRLQHAQLAQAAQSPLDGRHRGNAEQHDFLQIDRSSRRLAEADLEHEVIVLDRLQERQVALFELAQGAQCAEEGQVGPFHDESLRQPRPRDVMRIKKSVRSRQA